MKLTRRGLLGKALALAGGAAAAATAEMAVAKSAHAAPRSLAQGGLIPAGTSISLIGEDGCELRPPPMIGIISAYLNVTPITLTDEPESTLYTAIGAVPRMSDWLNGKDAL